MKFLLDTHIFLWYINGSSGLSEKYFDVISNANNKVFVSPVSIWECIIKQELGKLKLNEEAGKFLIKEREKHQFLTLPVLEEDLMYLHTLPNLHKDPFDRLLICQAISNKLVLITEDSLIKQYDIKTLHF